MSKKTAKKPNRATKFREKGLTKVRDEAVKAIAARLDEPGFAMPACKGCGERHGYTYDQTCRRDVCKGCSWPVPVTKREAYKRSSDEAKRALPTVEQRLTALETALCDLTVVVNTISGHMDKNAETLNAWNPLVVDDLQKLFGAVKDLGEQLSTHTHSLYVGNP